MAKDYIALGDVAARGAPIIEVRCGRCDRHGRLSVDLVLMVVPPFKRSVRAKLVGVAHADKEGLEG
jgi:hypothetical protein